MERTANQNTRKEAGGVLEENRPGESRRPEANRRREEGWGHVDNEGGKNVNDQEEQRNEDITMEDTEGEGAMAPDWRLHAGINSEGKNTEGEHEEGQGDSGAVGGKQPRGDNGLTCEFSYWR